MKRRRVLRFECEYCGELFDSINMCDLHEKEEHKCPQCKHSYYVYGCERNCTRENKGKKCKFEPELPKDGKADKKEE